MRETSKPSDRRLFFGLYPDVSERARLHALTPTELRLGERISPENLHITLVFLGKCDADREARARAAAVDVRMPPVDLVLDRVAVWGRVGVQVLLPPGTPGPLRALQRQLIDALVARGFPPESRPWVPHVTVARRISPQEAVSVPPVQLNFREFCLFLSHRVNGELVYEPVAGWGAGAPPDMG